MIIAVAAALWGFSVFGMFTFLLDAVPNPRAVAREADRLCAALGIELLKIPFLAKRAAFCEGLLKQAAVNCGVELLAGRQAALGILFGALGFLAGGVLPALPCASAGIFLPFYSVYTSRKKRFREISAALPDFLDLVTLLVESGCDLGASLKIVSSMDSGPLYAEITGACEDIRLGKGRLQALNDVAARVGEKHLASVMASLIQSMKAGAPVGKTLRSLSDQIRQERSADIEKQTAEAQIKMMFPIIIFIFPTIFLVIFGPIVLSFVR